jgi:O-antigen/teichoic acid export membrane protein
MTNKYRISGVQGLLASSAAVQGLGMGATLLVGVQLARYLGPAEYGIYGLVMAVVSQATDGAQFGLAQIAVREGARSMSSHRSAAPTAVIRWISAKVTAISATSSVLLTLLILLASPSWAASRSDLIAYAAATIFLLSLFGAGIGLLRGLGRNLLGQIIETLARPVATMIALFLLYRMAGALTVEDALIVQGCVIFAAVAGIGLFLLGQPAPREPAPDTYQPTGWVKTCLSFLSTTMLLALNANYPLLVAGLFVAAHDLGILRVALSSAALVALPTAIANIAVGPVVAKLHHDRRGRELADALSQTTIACFVTTLCALLVIGVAGRPLLGFAFGGEYVPAYPPLLILGAAQLVVSAFGITGTYLNMTGKERLVLRAFAITVPIGLLITVPLTAWWGISGATVGNLCMVVMWHWYVLMLNRRQIDAPLSLLAGIRHLLRRPAAGVP